MQSKNKLILIIGGAAIALMATTAAVASYMTRTSLEPASVAQTQAPRHEQPTRVASAQPQQPACDDSNIVGTAVGGVGGGVVGSTVGHGTGKTVATIAGALGGAYLGNQYIPTRNVTCRH